MKTIYNVYHIYDVDGGFGDAVSAEDLLFTTDNKEIADTFVTKYNNKYVYDTPYAELYRGELKVIESTIVENYDDIPTEIIQWGEENIKAKDFEIEELTNSTNDELDNVKRELGMDYHWLSEG